MAAIFILSGFAIAVDGSAGHNSVPTNGTDNVRPAEIEKQEIISENHYVKTSTGESNLNIGNHNLVVKIVNYKSTTTNLKGSLITILLNGKRYNTLFVTTDSVKEGTHETIDFNLSVLYTSDGAKSISQSVTVNSVTMDTITPSISGSHGWLGWAVSFSPANMKSLAFHIGEMGAGGTFGAIVTFIVQSGIDGSIGGPLGTVAGIIAGIIVGIGFYELNQWDMSHGNPGIYFAFDWVPPLTFNHLGLNPVSWGY
ncbi:MAG: hypothetical protein QXZ44_06640 [Ferroplasma sp.]